MVTKIDTVIKTVHVGDVRTAKYTDGWNNIEIAAGLDTTKIEFNSVDTLDVIGSVKQKKFLFFKIGKPIQKITVSNKNPKSTIHVNFSADFSK